MTAVSQPVGFGLSRPDRQSRVRRPRVLLPPFARQVGRRIRDRELRAAVGRIAALAAVPAPAARKRPRGPRIAEARTDLVVLGLLLRLRPPGQTLHRRLGQIRPPQPRNRGGRWGAVVPPVFAHADLRCRRHRSVLFVSPCRCRFQCHTDNKKGHDKSRRTMM